MKTWFILIVLVLLLSGGLAAFFMSATGKEALANLRPREKPLEVRMEKVSKGTLTRTVSAPGSVEPKTKVQVSAQVIAKIIALPFREGESVKKGDVIVRLDGRDLAAALESTQARLHELEASLKGAEADQNQSRQNLERVRKLFPQDATQAELERAEGSYAMTEARVLASRQAIEQARALIVRAQKDLENTVIKAEMDGTIVRLYAEVGETVVMGTLNNASSVIMEIADLGTMLMKVRVDEVNIAPVKAGQRAVITMNAYKNREFVGVVERVGLKKLIERDNTNYFEVEVAIEKPKDLTLGSGLTANADIQVETFTDVIKAPSQAVVDRRVDELPKELAASQYVDKNRAFARVVYVVTDGVVKAAPVSIGASDLTHTVIIGGLQDGQVIVAGPYRAFAELAEGMKVVEEGTKDAKGNLVGRKPTGAKPPERRN